MKKFLSVILAIILILGICCGCGAKSADYTVTEEVAWDNAMPMEEAKPAEAPAYEPEYDYKAEAEEPAMMTDGTGIIAEGGNTQNDFAEKIIRNAWVTVQTVGFEDSIDKVYALLEQYGAFLESSYISGKSYSDTYYNRQSYRNAEFTIRVPKENYSALTSSLDIVGNILESNSTIQNITPQYTDVESRLKTYRTEETRLQEMMAKAETVEDMITIESRLSQVTYEIESLTSTLKNWDNKVDYCTVHLTVSEVKEIIEQAPIQRSYWEEMRDGLRSSLKAVGRGFKNFFMWLVVNLPQIIVTLVVIAIVILVLVFLVKRSRKNKNKRREKRLAKKAKNKEADGMTGENKAE